MNDTIKVKSINDIPNIEHMLDYEFRFGSYDFNDQIRSYYCELEDDKTIEICLISEDQEILGTELLSDLITQQNIFYFCLSYYQLDDEGDYSRIKRYQFNK